MTDAKMNGQIAVLQHGPQRLPLLWLMTFMTHLPPVDAETLAARLKAQEVRIKELEEELAFSKAQYAEMRAAKNSLPHNEKSSCEDILLEIAERKKSEEALRHSQEILQSVIDNIPQLIFWKDRNSKYLGCNKLFATAAGLNHPDQIIGKSDRELPWAPEETDWFLFCDRRVMESNRPELHIAETLVHADGKKSWIDTCKIPLHDEQGRVCGVIGTIEDISHRKEAEEEIIQHRNNLKELVKKRTAELEKAKERAEKAVKVSQRQQDFLHALMETIPTPMFYKDTQGRYTGCNSAFSNYIGKPKDFILGKTVFEIADRSIAAGYHRKDLELFQNPGTQHYTWQVVRADGDLRDVVFDKATILDHDCGVVGLIGIITDITDLVRAKKEAESASLAKSEFLANMSHELRTPLTGVVGMANLLLNSPLNGEQRQYAEAAVTCADTLLTVIDDILDFSKIEAGKLDFVVSDFDLSLLLKDLQKIIGFQANRKGLLLLQTIEPQVPLLLRGDPARLHQVLLNLASNAVKFTEAGQVAIHIALKEETAERVTLHFRVIDTGLGIAPDQFHRLFQSFSQLDGSASRKYGGTGLGLAISKRLVTMMEGDIGVEANPAGGAIFWFEAIFDKQKNTGLTASYEKPKIVPPQKYEIVREVKILLAEDNSINQILALSVLQNLGYSVVAVENGRQAVQTWKHQAFDLILMDIQMPEMDGFEATQAIRKMEAELPYAEKNSGHAKKTAQPTGRRIPIIALTAHAMAGDQAKCLAAGMDDYITKPIVPLVLSTTIDKWLENNQL